MVPFITSPLFNEHKVTHGFFTRKGGVSTGQFSSLNCSHRSRDDAGNIRENLSRVASSLGFELNNLYRLEQIHTNVAHNAENSSEMPRGDAIFTAESNKLLTVQTADCTPILLYALDVKAAAAVHAGWRGAVDGVIQSAVLKLKQMGAAPQNILAAIGPCIQQKSYEVDELFSSQLIENDKANKEFFLRADGKIFFNLPKYCYQQLLVCGLKKIDDLGLDTYSDAENFFSFRRYTHECIQEGKERLLGHFGCQISAIAVSL